MTSAQYAAHVIGLYLRLPGGTGRAGRADWRLARTLQAEGVTLEIIEAAMLLVAARRGQRDPALPPLPPIRSLAYLRPVIDELSAQSMPASYLDYLRDAAPMLQPARPARDRKPALLRDR